MFKKNKSLTNINAKNLHKDLTTKNTKKNTRFTKYLFYFYLIVV
jgi:hypothetical protein